MKQKNELQLKKRETYLSEITDLQVTSKGLSMREMSLTVSGNLDKPNIASLRNPCDTPKLMTIINFAIQRASKVSALYKELDDELSISLTVDLMEKMNTDSIDDILLMFKMARQGDLNVSTYSKKKSFYETVLQDWVPAYLELKSIAMEKRYQNNKVKWDNPGYEPDSEFKEKIRKIRMSLRKPTTTQNDVPIQPNILNSSVELEEALTTLCKNWDKKTLEEAIEDYSKYNDRKRYVPIFENELKSRHE